jgi:peptide-methionine (S)-S-oxide reductase
MKRTLIAALVALTASASAAPAQPPSETAVLAGGCFWGMEAVFEHVKGVKSVVSGYAGGTGKDANYEAVSSERTPYAESVRITYDPNQITYPQLLQIYFAVAHDPTEVNRQGPDTGTSYRSAIFPQSAAQTQIARAFIARLNAAHVFKAPIATKIESGGFFPAESYHQGFARKHPWYPYIVINDEPKVRNLKAKYPGLWKA